ncbi:unnamed protein product [Caenorhabditis brenneri]
MILNLFTISALFGLAVCSGYGNNNNYAAANPGNGVYYQPPHHHRRHHWRSRSSSESDEKWDCRRIGILNAPSSVVSGLFHAPTIAYYTHQGEEKAIIVCPNPHIQILVAKSKNATPDVTPLNPNNIKDLALLSLSSKNGLTLDCKKGKRYEAFNFFSGKNVPIEAVTCISAAPDEALEYSGFFISTLQGAGFLPQ